MTTPLQNKIEEYKKEWEEESLGENGFLLMQAGEYSEEIAEWWIDKLSSIATLAQEEKEKDMVQKIKERDRKMYGYYKSVFEDGFEGGYPAEWDDFSLSNNTLQ